MSSKLREVHRLSLTAQSSLSKANNAFNELSSAVSRQDKLLAKERYLVATRDLQAALSRIQQISEAT